MGKPEGAQLQVGGCWPAEMWVAGLERGWADSGTEKEAYGVALCRGFSESKALRTELSCAEMSCRESARAEVGGES